MKIKNGQRGIVRTIIIVVIALLIMSYFGLNLQQIATSPTAQSNFSYVWNGVVYVWDTYLKVPATEAYDFFITYIWNPAIRDIQQINAGQLPGVDQGLQHLVLPPASTTPAVQ
jgi:hypothetical protein